MVKRRSFLVAIIILFISVPLVVGEDTWLEGSKGTLEETFTVHKFGILDSLTTSYQDIWTGAGTYVYPTVAKAVNVSSTDVDDTLLGAGARTVTVLGLDANFVRVSEIVRMDGQNNVTTTQTFLRVFRAFVCRAGVTEWNEGIISVTQDDKLLAEITALHGQTLMAIYTIPDGYTGYLKNADFTTNEDKVLEYEIIFRVNDTSSWRVVEEWFAFRSPIPNEYFSMPEFPEHSDIKMRAMAGSSSGEIGASMDLMMILDPSAVSFTNATQAVREVGIVDVNVTESITLPVNVTESVEISVTNPENQSLMWIGLIFALAVALAIGASGRRW